MVHPAKSAAARPARMMAPQSKASTQEVQRVLIPIRHFAAEIGRSRQFVYGELKLGRLKTILHGGRRFVHADERDRYVAAVVSASPDYGAPAQEDQEARLARRRSSESAPSSSGGLPSLQAGLRTNATSGRTLNK